MHFFKSTSTDGFSTITEGDEAAAQSTGMEEAAQGKEEANPRGMEEAGTSKEGSIKMFLQSVYYDAKNSI
jgi:hypothetical protein